MVKRLALNGDRMALKMCVERLIAPGETPNSRTLGAVESCRRFYASFVVAVAPR